MPELPEVETTRRGIAPDIEHKTVQQIIVRDARLRWPIPASLNADVAGQIIHQVNRRAKYLLLQADKGHLLIHLGMSGRLRILTQPLPPEKHDHVDIVFTDQTILRFTDPRRFGAVLWTEEAVLSHPLLHHLGPEPFDEAFNADYLYQRSRKRQISIKTFIMNAEIVVGVGNIYASEALFLAQISPQQLAAQLSKSQAKRLVESIQQVLNKAIAAGGTTLRDFRDSNGNPGYFAQALLVYGRQGEPCKHCDAVIQQIRQNNRATYFCPNCQ